MKHDHASLAACHYHAGLTLFSIFPAVVVFLITRQWYWAVSSVFLINIAGFFRTGVFLALSFHVLKPLAGLLGSDGFAPEQMVITLGTRKALRSLGGSVPPEKILLLLPHCLQNHECGRRITFNPYNCARCGKCPVGSLLDLADRTGVKVAVATGGTLARRHVKEYRPVAVVAVACPRDLGQGMLDAYPVPVVGVENTRPAGDCLDTQVDIELVENSIRKLTAIAK